MHGTNFHCITTWAACFYLQGILDNINAQVTSFPDCKHKHMVKSGAPPDKVGVLQSLLPIEFHGFTSRIDF